MNHCKNRLLTWILKCILCIANSSYAVKTPTDEVTCDSCWNFYKKLKIWDMFPT